MTEILTALQDFMTQDGSISNEQREFYKIFSQHLREHEGEFTVEDIERLLMAGKKDVPDLLDEEFFKITRLFFDVRLIRVHNLQCYLIYLFYHF